MLFQSGGMDPYKLGMARVMNQTQVKKYQSVKADEEWASAFKSIQTVQVKKRKEEAEKIKKDNMLKKFRELELRSINIEKSP